MCAKAALPYANDLLQVRLTFDVLATPLWIGAIVAFIVLTGALSGLLPALMISSAKPIDVVRGTFRRQTKMVFSKVFITFQNVITEQLQLTVQTFPGFPSNFEKLFLGGLLFTFPAV